MQSFRTQDESTNDDEVGANDGKQDGKTEIIGGDECNPFGDEGGEGAGAGVEAGADGVRWSINKITQRKR